MDACPPLLLPAFVDVPRATICFDEPWELLLGLDDGPIAALLLELEVVELWLVEHVSVD